jgi:hypothetical protein
MLEGEGWVLYGVVMDKIAGRPGRFADVRLRAGCNHKTPTKRRSSLVLSRAVWEHPPQESAREMPCNATVVCSTLVVSLVVQRRYQQMVKCEDRTTTNNCVLVCSCEGGKRRIQTLSIWHV